MIYDVTDRSTATRLLELYALVEEKRHDPPMYFVIGTKNDRKSEKQISIEETQQNLFANKKVHGFYEVSSIEGGPDFERCLKNIMETILLNKEGEERQPNPIPPIENDSPCCPIS